MSKHQTPDAARQELNQLKPTRKGIPSVTFQPQSTAELRTERESVVEQMHPYTVEILRRLRAVDAIDFREDELLDKYDTLTWVINDRTVGVANE